MVDVLLVIAVSIEQADGDERNAEVGSAFQVVAGEDTQPAGIDRDGFVKGELGTEVGDAHALLSGCRGAGKPGLAAKVGGQVLFASFELGEEVPVVFELADAVIGELFEQDQGVSPVGFPERRVERGEKALGVGVPCPAQVHSQVTQALNHVNRFNSGAFGSTGRVLAHGESSRIKEKVVRQVRMSHGSCPPVECGHVAKAFGQGPVESAGRQSPGPVAADGAGHVHAGLAVQPQQVLYGKDSGIGRG